MRGKTNIAFLKRRRQALLKRLARLSPFLGGSLVLAGRVCGYPKCACAKGKKHPTYYLTWARDKKTRTLYIPLGLLKETQDWVTEYKNLKWIINQMNEVQRQILSRYVKEKRAKARKKT